MVCEEPPSPGPCEGVQGKPSALTTTPVALPQGGGVKRTMLPMPGPRAMAASVSYYKRGERGREAPKSLLEVESVEMSAQ